MFRARTSIKAQISDLETILFDVDVRKRWEQIIFDFSSFDKSEEQKGSCSIYYVYKSPFGVADRDFLQVQKVWHDFPEPGMVTLFYKSIDDERFPVMKNRVRATCHIMALCCSPAKDESGKDILNCMLVTNIDINGLVPKWIVNFAARSAPSQWFVDCQRAIDLYHAGKLSTKTTTNLNTHT